jgi:hypothetical protein
MKSVELKKIAWFLDKELRIRDIDDCSRNGLQVEGAEKVRRVALAVDACGAAYRAAADENCQMIIAHHGLIWDGLPYITGNVFRQLKFLFDAGSACTRRTCRLTCTRSTATTRGSPLCSACGR